MAWEDRDYYRQSRVGTFGSRLGSHSMVTWLLVINCAVYILDMILSSGTRSNAISPMYWGNFNIAQAIYGLQIWRFVTYQFLHANVWHILFNMIALYFFGPLMEQWWGSRRFLAFYLLCGICGAAVMSVLSAIPGLLYVGPHTPLIGASGSIFGILVGCGLLFPKQRVMLLIPPIPMSMRTMALIFLGIAVLSVVVGSNAGGNATHLGGALLGFILVKFPRSLDWADASYPSISHKLQQRRTSHRQNELLSERREVDRILDKVKTQGLHSLTRREKKTLNRATQRQRRAG